MKKDLKIFKADFHPLYPVPHGLILAAYDENEAMAMALEALKESGITNTNIDIEEIILFEPTIIFFESGDY